MGGVTVVVRLRVLTPRAITYLNSRLTTRR